MCDSGDSGRATPVPVEVVPVSALRSVVVRAGAAQQLAAEPAAPPAARRTARTASSPPREDAGRSTPCSRTQPDDPLSVARSLDELALRVSALEAAVQSLVVSSFVLAPLTRLTRARALTLCVRTLQARLHALERDPPPAERAAQAAPAASSTAQPQHSTDELQAFIDGVTQRLATTRALFMTQTEL